MEGVAHLTPPNTTSGPRNRTGKLPKPVNQLHTYFAQKDKDRLVPCVSRRERQGLVGLMAGSL